ncbi:MAG: hypothetical protein WCL50_16805 [Spirochaetota bacterium]
MSEADDQGLFLRLREAFPAETHGALIVVVRTMGGPLLMEGRLEPSVG